MTQYLRPISPDISAGNWNPSTGITLWGCIDEVTPSTADYIHNQGASSTCEVTISSVTDPESSTGHAINLQAQRTASGASCTCYLVEGTTVRASFSVTVASTNQSTNYTLTAAEANSIVNYADLRLRFTGTRSRINWAQMQVPDPPARSINITTEHVKGTESLVDGMAVSAQPTLEPSVSSAVTLSEEAAGSLGFMLSTDYWNVLPNPTAQATDTIAVAESVAGEVETQPILEATSTESATYTEETAVEAVSGSLVLYTDWWNVELGQLPVAATDTVTLTDIPNLELSGTLTLYTDYWYVQTDVTVSVADVIAITEDVGSVLHPGVILKVDQWVKTDVAAVSVSDAVLVGDITDQEIPGITERYVQASEQVAISEAVDYNLTPLFATTTDQIAITDEPTASGIQPDLEVSASQTARISEAASGAVSIQPTLAASSSETVDIGQSPNLSIEEQAAAEVSATEIVATTELINTELAYSAETSDAVAVAEDITPFVSEQPDLTPYVADGISLTEAVAYAVGLEPSVDISEPAETISVAEEVEAAVSIEAGLTPWIADETHFTEALVVDVTEQYFEVAATDTVTIAEDISSEVSVQGTLVPSVAQEVAVTDSPTVIHANLVLDVTDTVAVSEGGITYSFSLEDLDVAVTDTVTLSEINIIAIGESISALEISTQAQISVGELTFAGLALQIAATDSVHLGESVIFNAYNLSVADHATLAESIQAVMYGFTGTHIITVQPRVREVKATPDATESHEIEAAVLTPGREVKGGS